MNKKSFIKRLFDASLNRGYSKLLQVRINPAHEAKLADLERETGANRSTIVRAGIELFAEEYEAADE